MIHLCVQSLTKILKCSGLAAGYQNLDALIAEMKSLLIKINGRLGCTASSMAEGGISANDGLHTCHVGASNFHNKQQL